MKFKICCISSVEEALLAKQYGAYALGLVGPMPSGPGVISNDLINEISNHSFIKNSINTFLLSSEVEAGNIISHHTITNTTHIQLVDAVTNIDLQKLKNELPLIKLVQVIHVINEASIDEALEKSKYVNYILLDSGNPNLSVKELGGTGRVHNWQLSKKIVEQCDKPVFLAGGINPENVAEAIETVQPFGIDVCSGVRSNGKLDEEKLAVFAKILNEY